MFSNRGIQDNENVASLKVEINKAALNITLLCMWHLFKDGAAFFYKKLKKINMVETFIIEDTKDLITDVAQLDEWKTKCEELGLENQLNLVGGEKDSSPIPFEHLNTSMLRMWSTLCPRNYSYREYDKTPIPLEVLSLIALCEKEKYFKHLRIWADDQAPDPVLIGHNYDKYPSTTNDDNMYIIARWGAEIEPIDCLMQKAIERKSNEYRFKQDEAMKKMEILNPVLAAQSYFSGGSSHYFSMPF